MYNKRMNNTSADTYRDEMSSQDELERSFDILVFYNDL